jgi:hypothetical protein
MSFFGDLAFASPLSCSFFFFLFFHFFFFKKKRKKLSFSLFFMAEAP